MRKSNQKNSSSLQKQNFYIKQKTTMGINPYKSVNGYTVVYNHGAIKIITKEKIDVMEGIIFLPKSLIQFILEFDLPSPLKATVLSLNEEVGCDIDSLCFSPDEKRGFLLCKNLYYITK